MFDREPSLRPDLRIWQAAERSGGRGGRRLSPRQRRLTWHQRIRADALPDDKARIIQELQEQGRKVAMAGDGVNDAPALAQADVGVAIESAGFTLVKGDLNGIVRARRLSRATMRNMKQDLFFALVYSTAGVPVAAGVLYPFLGILISPIFAAAAMSLSSLSVVADALRLRTVRVS